MSSIERNKILAAVLIAVLLLRGVNLVADEIFHVDVPPAKGWAVLESASSGQQKDAPDQPDQIVPIASLLPTADVAKGAKVFRKCVSCHTYAIGGKNKAGPALWGVIDRQIAAGDGYNYSPALKQPGAEGKVWDVETLSRFLAKPRKAYPGTKMAFAGLKKDSDRAAIIRWMQEQSK